jgi:hypothetical protein
LLKPAPPEMSSAFQVGIAAFQAFNSYFVSLARQAVSALTAVLKRAFICKLFGLNFYFNQTGSYKIHYMV